MIWDGGEVRRRFIDSMISQVNREYLERLISYTGHLKNEKFPAETICRKRIRRSRPVGKLRYGN
ncbi:MAG: hypothetical protein WDO15_30270 [Bacteroidota bacterium]